MLVLRISKGWWLHRCAHCVHFPGSNSVLWARIQPQQILHKLHTEFSHDFTPKKNHPNFNLPNIRISFKNSTFLYISPKHHHVFGGFPRWFSQDFLWILPGHGRRASFRSAAERRAALAAAADAFRADPAGHGAPGPVFQVLGWATNQLVG